MYFISFSSVSFFCFFIFSFVLFFFSTFFFYFFIHSFVFSFIVGCGTYLAVWLEEEDVLLFFVGVTRQPWVWLWMCIQPWGKRTCVLWPGGPLFMYKQLFDRNLEHDAPTDIYFTIDFSKSKYLYYILINWLIELFYVLRLRIYILSN